MLEIGNRMVERRFREELTGGLSSSLSDPIDKAFAFPLALELCVLRTLCVLEVRAQAGGWRGWRGRR